MTPTTATTGSPVAPGDGLTVRQRVSPPHASLETCVRERICYLHDRGTRTFTLDDFTRTAEQAGRPLSWIGDHLLVLEGLGVLRSVSDEGTRAWHVNSGSGYLR